MHKNAGLNMVRVWGGSIPERDYFYEAADKMGLLIMQDFQMSGDNNGRWGGDVKWPEDYGLYLSLAKETILRLRGKTSLMFYSGGNELYSDDYDSPPKPILTGLEGTKHPTRQWAG